MSPKAINSRIASHRSHSLTRRCTAGNERRRRSGRGGKSGPGPPAPLALPAATRFHPDQKTVAPHHEHGMAMKPVPAPPLILIPAQCRFCFLMILLHPVAAVGILDQDLQEGALREVTPEVFPVPVLPSARALPQQPPAMAGSIAIPPPPPQGKKLREPPPCGSRTPGDAVPGAPGLRDQHLIDPAHRAVVASAQHDTELARTAITWRS